MAASERASAPTPTEVLGRSSANFTLGKCMRRGQKKMTGRKPIRWCERGRAGRAKPYPFFDSWGNFVFTRIRTGSKITFRPITQTESGLPYGSHLENKRRDKMVPTERAGLTGS